MVGLPFDPASPATPDRTLLELFDEWVHVTAAGFSPATLRGYVSDLAIVGSRLLETRGAVVPPPSATTVPLTVRPERLSVTTYARAAAVMSVLTLGDVDPRKLGAVFDTLGADRSLSSVRRAAGAWSNFGQMLVRRGVLTANPMRSEVVVRPRSSGELPKPISGEEAARLLVVLRHADEKARNPWPQRDLALAATLLATGVRLGEVITTCVGDLTASGDAPRLQVLGKGNRRRSVVLTEEVLVEIRRYLSERQARLAVPGANDPLFVRSDGSAFSPRSLQRLVERWFVRAGVRRQPGAIVHTLRHTFGTMALTSGANVREVQEALGHSSLETSRRYLAVTGQNLVQLAQAHPVRQLLRDSVPEE